jgi:hypothetical protein
MKYNEEEENEIRPNENDLNENSVPAQVLPIDLEGKENDAEDPDWA